ncbi:Retrovirus-related Pol polyprotein from transposon 17.6 [Cucumis melo var. makuwa]|uniref:Retrovirus-related Pol polyprotein from transposon 17.6 n=1 Tax=Cucumis melo var. makuwa TaxID=1194695 RepID=A0A5D3DQP1_CUCMM|nr:Retrovirus-related Pol polyprotein from transposon 17.6 [Cucumis melo var. makuwa]
MMEATVDEVIKPHKSKVEVMTTRIMGGEGCSLNQNLETLLKTSSNDGRFGLGYKPSIYDKITLQEEKKEKRLAKLEMREFDPNNIHKNEDVSNSTSTLDALIYTMESNKESDDEDDVGISLELVRMVEEEDEVLGPHQELVEAINLGSQEESKEEEVQKQIKAGFLTVSKYLEWVANIVPVPKKDEKVRMCVDYKDLIRASPKDNFPLPYIDMLVDNTAGYSTFSFMDGFSGYNHIKMVEEDREKTTFIILWGTFCYKVMSFGLKNAGATYQRAMVTLFHDMMHKEIEVFVDDMIAKSKADEYHTTTLQKLFDRLRKHQLKLNPSKCTFGVTSGKLLGFIVSEEGIKGDSDKVRAIMEMPSSKIEKKKFKVFLED